MWMCYAEARRAEATDVRSAVELLESRLRDLAFEAGHEAVYGFGRTGFSEQELHKQERSYDNGAALCRLFLDNAIGKRLFVDLMNSLDLNDRMVEVEEFMEKEEEQ